MPNQTASPDLLKEYLREATRLLENYDADPDFVKRASYANAEFDEIHVFDNPPLDDAEAMHLLEMYEPFLHLAEREYTLDVEKFETFPRNISTILVRQLPGTESCLMTEIEETYEVELDLMDSPIGASRSVVYKNDCLMNHERHRNQYGFFKSMKAYTQEARIGLHQMTDDDLNRVLGVLRSISQEQRV